MSFLKGEFMQAHERVSQAYLNLTDKEHGGTSEQAFDFFQSVLDTIQQNRIYGYDDAYVLKEMVRTVKKKPACQDILTINDEFACLPELLESEMRQWGEAGMPHDAAEEFKERMHQMDIKYSWLFDETMEDRLTGSTRDQVLEDVRELYQLAEKASSVKILGTDAQVILHGLDRVDLLLRNANLSKDNVSHTHREMFDELTKRLPPMFTLISELGND